MSGRLRYAAARRSACSICSAASVLPLLTLFYASIQKISTRVSRRRATSRLEHFHKAFTMNAATTALGNSLWLGVLDRDARRAADGADLVDHLPLAAARLRA